MAPEEFSMVIYRAWKIDARHRFAAGWSACSDGPHMHLVDSLHVKLSSSVKVPVVDW